MSLDTILIPSEGAAHRGGGDRLGHLHPRGQRRQEPPQAHLEARQRRSCRQGAGKRFNSIEKKLGPFGNDLDDFLGLL